MAFLDTFAESSNFFAGLLESRDSLLECMSEASTNNLLSIRSFAIFFYFKSLRLTGTNGLNLTLLTGVLCPSYCIKYSEAYFVVAMYTWGNNFRSDF